MDSSHILDKLNYQYVLDFASTQGIDFVITLFTAIAAWLVGRWLIKMVTRLIGRIMHAGGKFDSTITHYLKSVISALLNIVLILAILDIFGVKTTSFAALLAGAGLAIGTAWSGMLGNFAAGMFMQVLRPYKVGDYIQAGGVEGTVSDMGILSTTIELGGVTITVGNNKIFSDTIKNYSIQPLRLVSCNVVLAHSVDPAEAIAKLQPAIAAIENVAQTPAPSVAITDFTLEGPQLTISAQTNNSTYWPVHLALRRVVAETFRKEGYPAPETPIAYRLEQ